jgi:hypothetical protein
VTESTLSSSLDHPSSADLILDPLLVVFVFLGFSSSVLFALTLSGGGEDDGRRKRSASPSSNYASMVAAATAAGCDCECGGGGGGGGGLFSFFTSTFTGRQLGNDVAFEIPLLMIAIGETIVLIYVTLFPVPIGVFTSYSSDAATFYDQEEHDYYRKRRKRKRNVARHQLYGSGNGSRVSKDDNYFRAKRLNNCFLFLGNSIYLAVRVNRQRF